MVNALSPFLLPPSSHTAEKVDDADQYYYPYYYNTKDNADIFYKPYSQQFDPWLAYYERQSELPQHAGLYEGPKDQLPQHTELYEGPKDQLPQHAGLYDGPINPQDNMIFDVPKLFLKHYNWRKNYFKFFNVFMIVVLNWRAKYVVVGVSAVADVTIISSSSVTASQPMLCLKLTDQVFLAFTYAGVKKYISQLTSTMFFNWIKNKH